MSPRMLSRQYGVQPSATVRGALLDAALAFVDAARRVPGVVRLALVGSLTTPKPFPKDADVLATVRDDVDLAALAALGRRFAGRAQALNGGADVFLASPDGRYLGRTCPWRTCHPGARVRCGARYADSRPFLRDDLDAVTLPTSLLTAPPIELWPAEVARVPVPPDVEAHLLAPLRSRGTAGRDAEQPG